jgi:hypothetical protein
MENIWPIILVGVIAAVAGYLFGMLDSRVTSALKEGREKAPGDEEKPTPKLDEHDVLKVTINQALKWNLELDGARIESDSLTPEQRTRLVNVIVQIRPWIDGKTVAPPVAVPAPVQTPPISAPALIDVQPAVAVPATALRLDIGRGFRSLLDSEVKKPEPPKPISIVTLIDEVLQKKLASSPLAAKKIRLEEGSVGEVVVFVGAVRYSGIDAVPDESIKAIIREAIAEWDKK